MSPALTASRVLAAVCDAVSLVCEVPVTSLSAETRLGLDLEADSVSLVEIIEVTEQSLAALGLPLTFADDELAGFDTIGDIASYVERHRTASVFIGAAV